MPKNIGKTPDRSADVPSPKSPAPKCRLHCKEDISEESSVANPKAKAPQSNTETAPNKCTCSKNPTKTRRKAKPRELTKTTEEVSEKIEAKPSRKPDNFTERRILAMLGYLIPKDHYTVITVNLKKAKNLGLRMNSQCTVTKSEICNSAKQIANIDDPPTKLRFGDLVISINGNKVQTKKAFSQLFKTLLSEKGETIQIEVVRLCTEFPAEQSRFPVVYEIVSGFTYHVAALYHNPAIKMSLSIKSYSGKVYISNVHEGTAAGMSFRIGDAIIDVNKEPVTSVNTAAKLIKKHLHEEGYVMCLVERPKDDSANGYIRMVLSTEKTIALDYGLANDVREICKRERKRFQLVTANPPQLRSILRSTTANHPKKRINFAENSEDTTIACDTNPRILASVAPREIPNYSISRYDPISNSSTGSSQSTSSNPRKEKPLERTQENTTE